MSLNSLLEITITFRRDVELLSADPDHDNAGEVISKGTRRLAEEFVKA